MSSFTAATAGQTLTAAYLNSMVGTTQSYTPVVTNGGTATFTTLTGMYARVGPVVFVNVDLIVGTAGSGSGIVSITLPSAPDRNQRQVITVHTESIGAGGNASSHIGGGEAVWFSGGSGAASDRIRIDEGGATARENNILGNDLLTTGHLTIQGWYLEA